MRWIYQFSDRLVRKSIGQVSLHPPPVDAGLYVRLQFTQVNGMPAKDRRVIDEDCGNGCVIFWSQRDGPRVPVRVLCGHIVVYQKLGLSRIRQRPGVCRVCSGQKRAEKNWRKRHGAAAVDAGARPNRPVLLDVRLLAADEREKFASMLQGHRRVAEHRLVMARKLDRPLLPNETVRHLNERLDDNRPDNLILLENRNFSLRAVRGLEAEIARLRGILERHGIGY